MKTIRLADMTLYTAAVGNGYTLSFKEKLEIARELDKLGVDVIETAPILDGKTDALLVRTAASLIQNSVLSCPVGQSLEGVEQAWNAVSGAAKPRLVVKLPVTSVQMEYSFGKKPAAMLQLISELVGAAKARCANVEFAAEDATRAEFDFLCGAVDAAIAAGAETVTLCDSAGDMLPGEFAALLEKLSAACPALREKHLGVQCSDKLGMAAACAFAAVGADADEVKVGITGADVPTLDTMGNVFRARGESLGLHTGVDMTNLQRAVSRMRGITDTQRATTSAFDNRMGADAAEHGSIALDESTTSMELDTALRHLGYELSGEDVAQVYERFKRIAVKKAVGAKELDAIVAAAALQVPPTYKLVSYVINSGNIINATAHIRMEKGGEVHTGLVTGDGPIDAAFLAVEQIVGRHYELDDFQIQAVTEGREAMGSTLVKLRANGKLYSGQGVSTDVIGASIRAYVDALNKIAYEENA